MAAIVGGMLVTGFVHAAIAKHAPDPVAVTATMQFSAFLMWAGCMVLAYYIKKPWHVWTLYLGITAICCVIAYL